MKTSKSVVCKCERCNKPFKAYEEQEHPLCRECRVLKHSAFEKRVCKDCGKEFTITVGEKEFYESKSLFLPARCSSCRKNRKTHYGDENHHAPEGGVSDV